MTDALDEYNKSFKEIVVGSRNPVKYSAVLKGFRRMFPEQRWDVSTVSVPSGVSDQPMSDAETLQGALNRAENAKKVARDVAYWVGLEGGVNEDENGSLQSFAWIVIKDNERTGKARTATFYQPEETTKLIKEGVELGQADDIVFGRENSKHANGSSGLLTGDVVNRTELYEQAVVLALIPFKNPNLTFKN